MGTKEGGVFLPPDEGSALINPIGGRMAIKLRDGDTAGAYSIHDNILPAGSPGPRPHIHRRHEEAFYVIEGELTVRVGSRTITAPAGSFVVIPRGTVHQPSNRTAQPTRVLLIFSPGGMDSFFADAAAGRMPLQAPTDDPAILSAFETFAAKYDFAFAEFPAEA